MTFAYSVIVNGQQSHEGQDSITYDCLFAVKTNLIHDALLTPDIGVEFSITKHLSFGIEGVYAWWSNDRTHRYWRIRGGWLDASWWFGQTSGNQRLSGHHAGIYASIHDYDFDFGGKGWQSPGPTIGAGVTYGYSFRLNPVLRLDIFGRIGYSGGKVIEYRPMCGKYTCIRERFSNYFGLTGLGISLVWLPGQCKSCDPKVP